MHRSSMAILATAALLLTSALPGPAMAAPGPTVAAPALADDEAGGGVASAVAARATVPIRVDGVLDEAAWGRAREITGFTQSRPQEGRPATERTVVRVLYDARAIYIGAILYDRAPDAIVATVLKRDQPHRDNDSFTVTLDTYHDRRNGYLFETNALGAKYDAQIVGEGGSTVGGSGSRSAFNPNWDAVWDAAGTLTESGWQVEMEIPLLSIRFDRDRLDPWGINFRRTIRRRSEESYWSPVPSQYGITRLSLGGDLTGLEGLVPPRNIEVQPFAIGSFAQLPVDAAIAGPPLEDDWAGDAGLDLKWGVTPSLTLDVTANTDFSQVEADNQQINLTRFSLFFPEKRHFFLENAGIFQFGGAIGGPIGFPGSGRVIGFHSRRIGISEDNTEVPLIGGGRLTGKAGPWSLGFMSLQTEAVELQPSTNYGVARVRREIGARSTVGVLFTNLLQGGDSSNRTLGIDGRFAVSPELTIDAWWMDTETPGRDGQSWAGHVLVDWSTPGWQVQAAVMDIGDDFNPEVGFVNRTGVRIYDVIAHRTIYPEASWVRNLVPHAAVTYATDNSGRLLTRNVHVDWDMFLRRSEKISLAYNRNFEHLDGPFEISDGVVIAPGAYHFDELDLELSSDVSRPVWGALRYTWGGSFDGDFARMTARAGFRVGARFATRLQWSRNDFDLPAGAFTTDIVRAAIAYDFSPRLSLAALVQYNSRSDQVLTNVRLNFIHTPGADLYLVYNERRLAEDADTIDRALILKVDHLLRF